MKRLPLFEASATLIGTVIGAGILGLPYVVVQVGFPLGITIMFVAAVAILVRQLMLAETTLRTPHIHQIPGYVGIYLGTFAKRITFLSVILGGYGTLLAYIIGEGEVLQALFGGTAFTWGIVFFAVASIFVFLGLNVIKRSELVMTVLIFLIMAVIGFFAWDKITFSHLTFLNTAQWALPYGVMLFALSGSVAIPQMRQELKGNEYQLHKAVFLASGIVFIIYLLFIFLVMGVSGADTTDIATIGLGTQVGAHMVVIGNVLAFFTMGTSFLTIGLAMKEMFHYDYGIAKNTSWALTIVVPLALFIVGIRNFIGVLAIVGGVLAGLQSIFMVFAFWKARSVGKRTPEWSMGSMRIVGTLLILFFVVGAVVTIMNSI